MSEEVLSLVPEPWEPCWRCGKPHCDFRVDLEDTETNSIRFVPVHKKCLDLCRVEARAHFAANFDESKMCKIRNPVAHEVCWAEIVEGDAKCGKGYLRNVPLGDWGGAGWGDTIRWDGGTDGRYAVFVGKCEDD